MTAAPGDWRPLVLLADAPDVARSIYCVHGGDGGVEDLGQLAREMKGKVRFFGLEARGRDGVLAPFETYEEEAGYLLSHIFARDEGPYVLAGYSGGGGIAFEMAQQIVRAGREVEVVFLFDTVEPSLSRSPLGLVQRLRMVHRADIRVLLEWPFKKIGYIREALTRKVRPETPRDRVFDAFLRSQARYEAKPYSGYVCLVRAQIGSSAHIRAGKALGWQHLAQGKFEICEVECKHLTMFREPAVAQLAGIVLQRLKAGR